MLSKEESEVVTVVFNRFLESEESTWTEIDENIDFISYLNDSELVKECQVKYDSHCVGTFRCNQEHEQQYCFAPFILEAVEVILDLYERCGELHPNHYYILSYYLALSEMNMIFVV
jgi:hypothetical protein